MQWQAMSEMGHIIGRRGASAICQPRVLYRGALNGVLHDFHFLKFFVEFFRQLHMGSLLHANGFERTHPLLIVPGTSPSAIVHAVPEFI